MWNPLKYIKLPSKTGDPKPFYAILAGGMVVTVLSVSLFSGGSEVAELEERHAELENRLATLDQSIATKQAKQDSEKMETIVEVTGLDPQQINRDTTAAEQYFSKAFNWTSGAEYDKARSDYDADLGKGNSFTANYFPENTKIDTQNGSVNYIDFKKLKSKMGDIYIVPITADGKRVRYAAFVRYYMHTDKSELNNLQALAPSDAIIQFTVAGEEGERKVSEVDAWAGFSAALE